MRSMKKGFHEELCSSDRSGQPDITLKVIKAHNLSENIRVNHAHDGTGQPDERNSSSAHTVKEQHAPEVHREIALLNTDNEFNREINEEDIDFNVPGLPHSAVKQLQSANVRELIQKIENHPNRHALQRDLQQSQSFNPFSQESKQMIHEVGNLFSIPDYYIKKGRLHGHRYGKKPGDKEYIGHQLKKKCKKKYFQGIHDRFVRDDKFRGNMIEIGRTEDLCRQMDDLADEDDTHQLTPQEIDNYKSNW